MEGLKKTSTQLLRIGFVVFLLASGIVFVGTYALAIWWGHQREQERVLAGDLKTVAWPYLTSIWHVGYYVAGGGIAIISLGVIVWLIATRNEPDSGERTEEGPFS